MLDRAAEAGARELRDVVGRIGLRARRVESRIEVEVDPACDDPIVRLAKAPVELLRREHAVDVVADLLVSGAEAAAGAVEIEVDIGEPDEAAPAPVVVVERDESARAGDACAVFGGGERREIDVGRRKALSRRHLGAALAERFAEEDQRGAGTVAHGGLGDDDRHRQEALPVEQPFGGVEGAVLGILEQRAALLFLRERRAGERQRRGAAQPGERRQAACSPVMEGSRVAAAATATSPPPAICTVGNANLMPFASKAFLIRA